MSKLKTWGKCYFGNSSPELFNQVHNFRILKIAVEAFTKTFRDVKTKNFQTRENVTFEVCDHNLKISRFHNFRIWKPAVETFRLKSKPKTCKRPTKMVFWKLFSKTNF